MPRITDNSKESINFRIAEKEGAPLRTPSSSTGVTHNQSQSIKTLPNIDTSAATLAANAFNGGIRPPAQFIQFEALNPNANANARIQYPIVSQNQWIPLRPNPTPTQSFTPMAQAIRNATASMSSSVLRPSTNDTMRQQLQNQQAIHSSCSSSSSTSSSQLPIFMGLQQHPVTAVNSNSLSAYPSMIATSKRPSMSVETSTSTPTPMSSVLPGAAASTALSGVYVIPQQREGVTGLSPLSNALLPSPTAITHHTAPTSSHDNKRSLDQSSMAFLASAHKKQCLLSGTSMTKSQSPTPNLIYNMTQAHPNISTIQSTHTPIITTMAVSSSSLFPQPSHPSSDAFLSLDKSCSVSSAVVPVEKRRQERNMREQQRSYKISQQIKELRSVLVQSNIPFKPNKFSILMSVVEYIKQLQGRAIYLDGEHHKLIATIRQASEMVNSGQVPSTSPAASANETSALTVTPEEGADFSDIGNDSNLLFVRGIDYKAIFSQCTAALGVAALDGRFLDCNTEFEIVSGYSREELRNTQSLFNLLTGQDINGLFSVLGQMLKDNDSGKTTGIKKEEIKLKDSYWSGVVIQKRPGIIDEQILMNITLARTSDGMPKFFNCALSAVT